LYFAVFYYAVIRNEEEDLRRRFGATFEAYAARVPLFFPGLGNGSAEVSSQSGSTPPSAFSWAQYRRNREYQALLGTIAGLGIMWLRMWIRAKWGY
jgi:hypothetical protein